MKEIIINKNNTLKIVSCSLLIVALMSGTAFASAGQPGLNKVTPVNSTISQKEETTKNMVVSGTVESITDGKDSCTISISNEDMGMVFYVQKGVFVVDKKTSSVMSIADIKKDMKISAIIDNMSPMTLSLPPQTSGAIGFVINSDLGSVNVSTYDDNLVNAENTLKLNIIENTRIIDRKGSKRIFTAEDIKGSECLVLYSVSTRSIPAQTTPEVVMILDKNKNDKPAKYVHLRTAAEAKGYNVHWDPARHMIILTKDGEKVEIAIGKTEFKFEHRTKDIKPLDRMERLDTAVKLEDGKTMVPDTFIDAL